MTTLSKDCHVCGASIVVRQDDPRVAVKMFEAARLEHWKIHEQYEVELLIPKDTQK